MDYEKFFGLKDTPFRLTPDPDYYFPSEVHKEALQTLVYSIQANEGFIQITGDPGTGKTVTLRTFLKQMGDEVDTALVLNPRLSPRELLKVILEDLGFGPVEPQEDDKELLLRVFRNALIEKAKHNIPTIVIVDEAQNLPNDTLEELRLLSNLETEKKKLLQIILVGQINLDEKLASPELEQLAQRITIRYRLDPLSKEDTFAYIRHRLSVAGGNESTRFSPKVLNDIYKASGGVPRLINIICERSLMAAFVDGKNVIEKPHFQKALGSIVGEYQSRDSHVRHHLLTGLVVLISLILGVGLVFLIARVLDLNGFFFSKPVTSSPQTYVSQTTTTTLPVVRPNDARPANTVEPLVPQETQPGESEAPLFAESESVGMVEPISIQEPDPTATPPKEAVIVPDGEVFISLNRNANRARLWQSNPSPVLRTEYRWNNPPPGGLYILGRDSRKQVQLFRYPPIAGDLAVPDSADWDPIRNMLDKLVIPVLIMPGNQVARPEDQERGREVETLVNGWVEDWRKKDIEGLMSYYGASFASYTIGRTAAKIYTKADLKKAKEDVFNKSGAINVELTDPVVIMDPTDPTRVLAAFFQKYESSVYSDLGTKVLYFKLAKDRNGKTSWQISAQLWIPMIGR